jgi:tetratricopeptide (TPR) repeat protein
MLKRTDAGMAEIRTAQELGLVSAKTHLNLSYAHLLKNEAGDAAAEARRAIELDPSLAMAYNNLGIAQVRNGLIKEAEGAFRKALDLDSNYKDAYLGLGSLLSVLGKRGEALGLLLKATALDPNDGVVQNNIAVLYFQKGSYAEAWDHARKALDLGFKVDASFLKELQRVRKSPGATPIV